jgi:hypothetical protein
MGRSCLQTALTVGPNSIFVSLPFYQTTGTDPPPKTVFFFLHKTPIKVQTLKCLRVPQYHHKALELVQYFRNLIAPSDIDKLPGECSDVSFALLEVLCLLLPLAAPCSVWRSLLLVALLRVTLLNSLLVKRDIFLCTWEQTENSRTIHGLQWNFYVIYIL